MIDGTMHRGARWLTFVLAVFGVAASLALLFVVTMQPQLVEQRLQSFAIAEVEERAKLTLDQAQVAAAESENGLLQSLARRFADDAEILAERRDEIISALVRGVAQDRCGDDCSAVMAGSALVSMVLQERVAQLRIGERTLGEFVADRYAATVDGLLGDLRSFAAANLIAFLTLIFLSIFRGRLGARILPMTLLLTGYVLYAAYWYVFGQDWASVILFNDWAAGAYVTTMIIVYILLIDFTFLRGKITDFVFSAIGSAFSAIS